MHLVQTQHNLLYESNSIAARVNQRSLDKGKVIPARINAVNFRFSVVS